MTSAHRNKHNTKFLGTAPSPLKDKGITVIESYFQQGWAALSIAAFNLLWITLLH